MTLFRSVMSSKEPNSQKFSSYHGKRIGSSHYIAKESVNFVFALLKTCKNRLTPMLQMDDLTEVETSDCGNQASVALDFWTHAPVFMLFDTYTVAHRRGWF